MGGNLIEGWHMRGKTLQKFESILEELLVHANTGHEVLSPDSPSQLSSATGFMYRRDRFLAFLRAKHVPFASSGREVQVLGCLVVFGRKNEVVVSSPNDVKPTAKPTHRRGRSGTSFKIEKEPAYWKEIRHKTISCPGCGTKLDDRCNKQGDECKWCKARWQFEPVMIVEGWSHESQARGAKLCGIERTAW